MYCIYFANFFEVSREPMNSSVTVGNSVVKNEAQDRHNSGLDDLHAVLRKDFCHFA